MSREFLNNYPRRVGTQTGPVALRWPFRFLWRHESGEQDTRFEFPHYPRARPARFVGPTALRRPTPIVLGTEFVPSNTRFMFPVYPRGRKTGPMATRRPPLVLGTKRAATGVPEASVITTSVVDIYTMTTEVE